MGEATKVPVVFKNFCRVLQKRSEEQNDDHHLIPHKKLFYTSPQRNPILAIRALNTKM